MTLRYAELAASAGRELGTSRWFEMDQARIDAFGEVTEDRQWIHVDPDAAARGPYGTTIVHGYLTLAMVSPILLELLVVEGVATYVNYGLDRVRFPAPLPSGSRIRGSATILRVTELPGGFQLTIRVTIAAEGAGKPACVVDALARLTPA